MITNTNKTPEIIYIQENMNEKMYGVNQDGNLPGIGPGWICEIL